MGPPAENRALSHTGPMCAMTAPNPCAPKHRLRASNSTRTGSARSSSRLAAPAASRQAVQKSYWLSIRRSPANSTEGSPPPLDITARRTSGAVAVVEQSICTLRAPALWPMSVMLPGSPPKAAMLSCTHCTAHNWSYKP